MSVTKQELELADKAWEDAFVLSEAAWKAWRAAPSKDGRHIFEELDKRADELRDAYFELSTQYGLQESIRRREALIRGRASGSRRAYDLQESIRRREERTKK